MVNQRILYMNNRYDVRSYRIPDWANYLAFDGNGDLWIYDIPPVADAESGTWWTHGRSLLLTEKAPPNDKKIITEELREVFQLSLIRISAITVWQPFALRLGFTDLVDSTAEGQAG